MLSMLQRAFRRSSSGRSLRPTRRPAAGVVRRLALAAAIPLTVSAAPVAAQTTYWHGWTFIEANAGVTFNKLEVSFANTGGVNMRSVFNTSIPGVNIVNAPVNGYTLNWPAGTPFKPGETVTAQFNGAAANATMLAASAYNGAVLVGNIDTEGVLRNANGVKLGQLAPGLAIKPGAAELAIIDRINVWGNTLGGAFGSLMAHAEAMTELYTADASLLPTLGVYALYLNKAYLPAKPNAPIILNYFRHQFLPKKPIMLPLNLGSVHVTVAGNLASANGLYTFKLTQKGCQGGVLNPPKITHARFTFVFRNVNGTWRIVQHHSSSNPRDKDLKQAPLVCLADINSDEVVDGADLGLLLGAWATNNQCADLNADGTVNGSDLGILLGEWGPCP